ncbi:MAG TPA: sulfotransferase [Verrucomicrobiae bacterium]|nr:sulfotransferase [Verrucomicrobiae bacterium]
MLLEDALFRTKRFLLGKNRVRRCRTYCIGIAKSGTHSIAGMFSRNVLSGHETRALELTEKILAWQDGSISDAQMTAWLHVRDRQLGLEVDSSPQNIRILDFLLKEFPDARFILTTRDCYSWLESVLNHDFYFQNIDERWLKWRRAQHDAKIVHAPEEQSLKEKNLYPIESYLTGWDKHHREVLAKVPAEKLLIVRVDEIKKRALEIADFAHLPRYSIQIEDTHKFKNIQKVPLLRDIDRDFLTRKVNQHCGEMMARFFPEIKSAADARY